MSYANYTSLCWGQQVTINLTFINHLRDRIIAATFLTIELLLKQDQVRIGICGDLWNGLDLRAEYDFVQNYTIFHTYSEGSTSATSP